MVITITYSITKQVAIVNHLRATLKNKSLAMNSWI